MQQRLAQACSVQLVFDEGESQHLTSKSDVTNGVHQRYCCNATMFPQCYCAKVQVSRTLPGVICLELCLASSVSNFAWRHLPIPHSQWYMPIVQHHSMTQFNKLPCGQQQRAIQIQIAESCLQIIQSGPSAA